jgi:hypothetical protein
VPLPCPAGEFRLERAPHPHFPLAAANRSGALAPNSLLRDGSRRVLEGQVQGAETPIPDRDGSVLIVDESSAVGGRGGAEPRSCSASWGLEGWRLVPAAARC